MKDYEAFVEWFNQGIKNNWISPVHCSTHDGPPMTQGEIDDWAAGDDICIDIVRLIYGDGDLKFA